MGGKNDKRREGDGEITGMEGRNEREGKGRKGVEGRRIGQVGKVGSHTARRWKTRGRGRHTRIHTCTHTYTLTDTVVFHPTYIDPTAIPPIQSN